MTTYKNRTHVEALFKAIQDTTLDSFAEFDHLANQLDYENSQDQLQVLDGLQHKAFMDALDALERLHVLIK